MDIRAFSEENFAEALRNGYTLPETIKGKWHFPYFIQYLKDLKAQYMVMEEGYISKDYLHDYANYYALCFKPYDKFCRRIHFFNTTLTKEILEKALLGTLDSPINIWDNYLGFIVVKPIPTTVIGYTVLKNYNHVNNLPHRRFWGEREYKAHFFGHEISFPSLAFQEQDNVLAACATTAVWTMLNKASIDHHTVLKSPSHITRDADTMSRDGSRLFPNKGLDISQICQSILHSGLVTEVRQWDDDKANEVADDDQQQQKNEEDEPTEYITNAYTKRLISAYSGLCIPIILVIEVPNKGKLGLHAIAVSGCMETPIKPQDPGTDTYWTADNIENIYAHDDQFGPYVRIKFQDEYDLITPWTDNDLKRIPTKVTAIIISVYPKVRISYDDIEAIVRAIDPILQEFFNGITRYALVWDIKIQPSETLKKELVNWTLPDNRKLELLQKSLPKYVWTASCFASDDMIFVFVFDATDVIAGMIGLEVMCFSEKIKTALCTWLNVNRRPMLPFIEDLGVEYYQFLIDQLE